MADCSLTNCPFDETNWNVKPSDGPHFSDSRVHCSRILATIIHSIVLLESSEIVSFQVHFIDRAMHCRTCVDIFTRFRETSFNQLNSKYWLSYSTLEIYWSFGVVPLLFIICIMHSQNTTSIDSSAVCVDTVLSLFFILFFFSPSAFWLTYSFSFVRIIQWWYQVAESGTLWALFLFLLFFYFVFCILFCCFCFVVVYFLR